MPEGFGSSCILFLLGLAPAALAAAPATIAAAPDVRENLEYQISLGLWSDVARVHLVFKEVEAGALPGGVFRRRPGDVEVVEPVAARTLPD